MKPLCLTIAGADPTSGAGIQADIRTFDRIGVHPFSVITAITFQTATKFYGYNSLKDSLEKQLDTILSVYPIKHVKIGMIPDLESVNIIKEAIQKYSLFAVLDPITISSAGGRLSRKGLEYEIERILFPHVNILTPNRDEAAFYSNIKVSEFTHERIKEISIILLKKLYNKEEGIFRDKAVIIKNGLSNQNEIHDIFCATNKLDPYMDIDFHTYKKKKLPIKGNIHGTGCVFSSALTAFLAKEVPLKEAFELTEAFFNESFQNYLYFNNGGQVLDLTISEERLKVVNQIKEIYSFISENAKSIRLIPEVRLNISCSLPNAVEKSEIAGIEGRVTIVNGFPKACGEVKFGISDHTARLILAAKKFDNSINLVTNLRYSQNLIDEIINRTDLNIFEFLRETEPLETKSKEFSTMHWLIKKSFEEKNMIPDIIWDKGAIGKEPIIRLFAKDSKDLIKKLKKILDLL